EPGRDIAIEIIGARPGEKIPEDLFNPYETPVPTEAPRILRAERPPLNPDWVEEPFDRVGLLVLAGDAATLAETGAQLAPARARTWPGRPRPRAACSRCRSARRLRRAPPPPPRRPPPPGSPPRPRRRQPRTGMPQPSPRRLPRAPPPRSRRTLPPTEAPRATSP